ncbi:MAG: LptE family protein [Candidatus Eisenbacteria bacterium]
MLERAARLVLGTVALGVIAGCAYTSGSALLPGHLRSVSIPTFENGTTEYVLEKELTQAVIDKFIADNHLRVVDERSAAAVLRGRIVGYKNAVFGFTGANRAQEYRVTITVDVTFKDLVKNREVWKDPEITKYANYYVQPVPGDSARTELQGRREAIAKIADEILSRTVEGW